MPRDLVGAPMILTGTVHVDASCVVLQVEGGTRWLLTGSATTSLTDGSTATVRGRPIPPPSGCPADRALAVRGVL